LKNHNSPSGKNNGFGEGLFAMSFLLMQTLLPPAPATASTRSTGLPLLFLLALLFFFFSSFFFLFFIFRFFSFLFLFSFYFFIFLFFIFSPSFPHLIFLVALSEGARKGIINNNNSIFIIDRNNFVNFQKFLTID
jgi:hypothetical protein